MIDLDEKETTDFPPAATTKPAGPQIKKRVAWVDLPAEYEGFKVEVWVNAPTKYWTAIGGGDESEAMEAVQKIVLQHNNWLDFDGQPYPPATDPDFWMEIPTELAACVFAATQAQGQILPNSIASKRRRSRRG